MPVANDNVLNHLGTCAEKCTAEQHWVVASVTAVDAAIIAGAEHLEFCICVRLFATILLIIGLVCGVWFIRLRHNAYYFYRDAMANMLKDEEYLPRELREPANRGTKEALSGLVVYSLWIVLTSGFALALVECLTRRCC